MMKFWIGVDVVLCMVFCICGYLLIQSVRQSTTQKNIRKFIELTADYKQAVDSFKNNFEKSGEIIPHIQTSVDDMAKVLVSIRDFGIKIPGMNRRIEPFRNNRNIQNGIEGFHKTSAVLNDYRNTTYPAVIAGLENTSKRIEEINVSLSEYNQYNTFYFFSFMTSIIAVFVVNIIIIMIISSKLQKFENYLQKI